MPIGRNTYAWETGFQCVQTLLLGPGSGDDCHRNQECRVLQRRDDQIARDDLHNLVPRSRLAGKGLLQRRDEKVAERCRHTGTYGRVRSGGLCSLHEARIP